MAVLQSNFTEGGCELDLVPGCGQAFPLLDKNIRNSLKSQIKSGFLSHPGNKAKKMGDYKGIPAWEKRTSIKKKNYVWENLKTCFKLTKKS